jgi:transposase-like protein
LLFLKKALKHCHGLLVMLADRGDWYHWPLDLLDSEPKRETWRDRSLIEA